MTSGNPFPDYVKEKSPMYQCPLPNNVDQIQTSLQCNAAMSQCQLAAAQKAMIRNDPSYHQYGNWFGRFNHQQQSKTETNHLGQQNISLWAGCHLLDTHQGRRHLWPVAKESLKDQLFRFHSNKGSSFATQEQQPIVNCRSEGANFTCS